MMEGDEEEEEVFNYLVPPEEYPDELKAQYFPWIEKSYSWEDQDPVHRLVVQKSDYESERVEYTYSAIASDANNLATLLDVMDKSKVVRELILEGNSLVRSFISLL